MPIDGCVPVPGVVVDPGVASSCVHCIEQLGCLEITQRCLQGDDTDTGLQTVHQSLDNEMGMSDMPGDISLQDAGEGDASEDECAQSLASRGETWPLFRITTDQS